MCMCQYTRVLAARLLSYIPLSRDSLSLALKTFFKWLFYKAKSLRSGLEVDGGGCRARWPTQQLLQEASALS